MSKQNQDGLWKFIVAFEAWLKYNVIDRPDLADNDFDCGYENAMEDVEIKFDRLKLKYLGENNENMY